MCNIRKLNIYMYDCCPVNYFLNYNEKYNDKIGSAKKKNQ